MSKEKSLVNKHFIIFDLETNGFAGSSVLSISAIKVEYLHKMDAFGIIDSYNRYYYRNENELINFQAIKINGLTDDKINTLRNDSKYPVFFKDDIDSFKLFCDTPALYIAHNISFDKQFIPFIDKNSDQFCTMLSNTFILKDSKWPKLEMTAKFYNIKISKKSLHESQYDVALCFDIIKAMHKNKNKDLLKILTKKGVFNEN